MWPPSSGSKRQQVQERERHAHEPDDLEVVAEADPQRRCGHADDADRARQLAALLRVEDGPERAAPFRWRPASSRSRRAARCGRADTRRARSPGRSPRSSGRPASAIVFRGPSVTRRAAALDRHRDRLAVARADQRRDALERRRASCRSRRRRGRPPAGRPPPRACSPRPAPTSRRRGAGRRARRVDDDEDDERDEDVRERAGRDDGDALPRRLRASTRRRPCPRRARAARGSPSGARPRLSFARSSSRSQLGQRGARACEVLRLERPADALHVRETSAGSSCSAGAMNASRSRAAGRCMPGMRT